MPLSLLEAYASGLPVITSDAGGIPWIARDGDTARVLPAGDTRAMADGMLDVLTNQVQALQRAANARRYVGSEFAWEHVGPKWKRAYLGTSAGRSVTDVSAGMPQR